MDGISDIFTLYRIFRKTRILRLITRARNPKDIITSVVAHQIHNLLKELRQAFVAGISA